VLFHLLISSCVVNVVVVVVETGVVNSAVVTSTELFGLDVVISGMTVTVLKKGYALNTRLKLFYD
jgi:hypothetical protein